MPEPVVQRIVPGAPPPAPLSKSQLKKRRKAKGGKGDSADAESPATPVTAAGDKAFEARTPEAREGSLAPPEGINRSESQATPLPEEDVLLKHSPIVELVNKRLKATTKKIGRITIYAATDPEKLNDDQKRTLKTLPVLEAIQKELGEVKKAIEVHEAELAQELAVKRAEAEKAEKARIADAVSAAETALLSKTNAILDLLRLRSLAASGAFDVSTLADATELSAFFAAADALLADDESRKQAAVKSLLFGQELDGVPSSRLLEIVHLAFNPPRAPTPPPAEPEVPAPQPEAEAEADAEPATTEPLADSTLTELEAPAPVAGVPSSAVGGSFRFIQDSEILEASVTTVTTVTSTSGSFEEGAEWIEKSDAVPPSQEGDAAHSEGVNGHAAVATVVEETVITAAAAATNGPIDWAADDEGGLPSIAGLQAEFGTSGSATPAEPASSSAPSAAAPLESAAPAVNGHVNGEASHAPASQAPGGAAPSGAHTEEDDGFTQARGRGRGRGGPRGFGGPGHERGGPRVGFRGDFRGGRGGFRGGDRGAFRGGEGRGGFRGGEGRGGFRGGEGRGGFRGGDRGRGEWRGGVDGPRGGRGRGRGGDRGGAPATPTTPAPAAAA